MVVQWASFYFFGLAAIIHFAFFIYESFVLQRPKAQASLGLSDSEFRIMKLWALNQGFYNLALSLGTFLGLYFVTKKQVMQAGLITSFCGFTMVLAGIVLFFSSPKHRKLALLQVLPPLIGFAFLVWHIADRMSGQSH